MEFEILNMPMAIIHVFFIPMITMLIYYSRSEKLMELNGEFFVRYGVNTVFVVTIAKVITSVIYKVSSVRLKIDSTYFGIIAIFVAFIMPYVIELLKKNIEIKCEIKGNKNENK